MISKLTQEQIELMDIVKDEWLNLAILDPKPIDKKATEDLLDFYYGLIDKKRPEIIYADSMLACQYVANTLAHGSSQALVQVSVQVSDKIWAQVAEQTCFQFSDQVRDKVWAQVREKVTDNVLVQFRNQISNQVLDQVEKIGVKCYTFTNKSLIGSHWVALYDYFDQIGCDIQDLFKKYRDLLKGGVPFEMILFEGVAIVCPSPKVKFENDVLHSESGPAYEFDDGFCGYALKGVMFDKDEWQKIIDKTFDSSDLAKIGNVDKRAAAISMLSPEKLLSHMGAKLIATGEKGTLLYKAKNFMDRGKTEYCMTMVCPSTGLMYLEWVMPKVGKKHDADYAQRVAFTGQDGPLTKKEYMNMEEA